MNRAMNTAPEFCNVNDKIQSADLTILLRNNTNTLLSCIAVTIDMIYMYTKASESALKAENQNHTVLAPKMLILIDREYENIPCYYYYYYWYCGFTSEIFLLNDILHIN